MAPEFNELTYEIYPIDPDFEVLGYAGWVQDAVNGRVFATAVSGTPANVRKLLVRKLRKLGFTKEDYSFLLVNSAKAQREAEKRLLKAIFGEDE